MGKNHAYNILEILIPNWTKSITNRNIRDDLIIELTDFNNTKNEIELLQQCYAIFLQQYQDDDESEKLLLELSTNETSWIKSCYAMQALALRYKRLRIKISKLFSRVNKKIDVIEKIFYLNLRHDNPIVRCIACQSIATLKVFNISVLVTALENEPQPIVRAYILDTLIDSIGNKQWTKALIDRVWNFKEVERHYINFLIVTEWISRNSGSVIEKLFRKLLNDADNLQQELTLLNWGFFAVGKETRAKLIEYIRDGTFSVRGFAQESLAMLFTRTPTWENLILITSLAKLYYLNYFDNCLLPRQELDLRRILISCLYALGRTRNLELFRWFKRDGNYLFYSLFDLYLNTSESVEYPRDFYYSVLISNLIAISRNDKLSEIAKNEKSGSKADVKLIKQFFHNDLLVQKAISSNWEEALKMLHIAFETALSECLKFTDDSLLIANVVYALGEWGTQLSIANLSSFFDDDRSLRWKEHGHTFFDQEDESCGEASGMGYWLNFYGHYDSGTTDTTISTLAYQAVEKIKCRNHQDSNDGRYMSFWSSSVETYFVPPSPIMYGGSIVSNTMSMTGDFYKNTIESMNALYWCLVLQHEHGNNSVNFFEAKNITFKIPFKDFVFTENFSVPFWRTNY